ncbi:N-acetylmuramidase family protein [Methylorubrum rhodesianum]|uniref:N-acetylmuramidase family protein n=1 Tax=Methylorubrum rhodesianum TaxID=29427 RepID=UPI003D2CEC68
MAASPDAGAFARLRAAGFVSAATRLTDYDLPRIGHTIGVGEDEIHAVMEVEAAGGGFDRLKRPKMLFEPHVFWRNLAGAERTRAASLGLAYAAWKPGAYPTDSYPRLMQAMAINETAALKASSWGLGQILGENHKAAGYATPQAMVLAFCNGGEAEHLAAMVRFIVTNGLDDELRRHDWAGFARGYNGAGYAKHGYHTKLAAAFAKWSKIKDTPWSPGMGEPVADPLAPLTGERQADLSLTKADPANTKPAPTGGLVRSGVQATGGAVRSGLAGLYDLIHTAFRKG